MAYNRQQSAQVDAVGALVQAMREKGIQPKAPIPSPSSPSEFASRILAARWQTPPHIALINSLLVEAATGKLREQGFAGVIVQVPPRHGKSTLCSEWFPAWYVGRYPEKRVILTSYEADFAASWGRKARNILAEHGKKVMGCVLNEDVSAAARWETVQGGGMVTAGVGGAITGRGADVAIVDDPVKNAEEAASATVRDSTWEWYLSTLRTRLEPGGTMVVIMTRWHPDDLVGRLIKAMRDDPKADQWKVVRLPAIAEEGQPDAIGRQPGEALWPERYPASVLSAMQTDTARRVWLALYQQTPVDAPAGSPVYDASRLIEVEAAFNPGLRLFAGLDFGFACPFCQIAQVDIGKDGTGKAREVLRFLWEVTKFNSNVVDFAGEVFDQMERLFPREAINGIEWAGDIAGNQRSDKGNESSIELFQAVARERGYKCFIQTMSQQVEWGINLIQSKVSAGEVEINRESCHYLKRALRGNYVRNTKGEPVGGVEGHPYTDAADAARYMVARVFGVHRRADGVSRPVSNSIVSPAQQRVDDWRSRKGFAVNGRGGRIAGMVTATGVWRPKPVGVPTGRREE